MIHAHRYIPGYEEARRYWQAFLGMPPAWSVVSGSPEWPSYSERLFFVDAWSE
jgi:hypothetical protein